MKTKLTIHVGHGKTGTSAIQAHLADNQELLESFGITYPLNHMRNMKNDNISSGNRRDFYDFTNSFLKEGTIPASPHLLFSSELLFRELLQKKKLLKKLDKAFDLEIVLFVRDFFDHMISVWGQSVKRGGLTKPLPNFALENYNILTKVDNFLAFLTEAGINFKVTNYNTHKKNIVEKFLELTTEEHADNIWEQSKKIKGLVNRSLTLSECELQMRFNQHFGADAYNLISQPLITGLPGLKSDKPSLDPDIVTKVQEKFAPIAKNINKHLPKGEKISLKHTPANVPTPSDDDQFLFSKEQIEIISNSIAQKIKGLQPDDGGEKPSKGKPKKALRKKPANSSKKAKN